MQRIENSEAKIQLPHIIGCCDQGCDAIEAPLSKAGIPFFLRARLHI
ncbi:MAG: hypothetical protein HONDAALG_00478 [Gammaproteobacteria bacterium]|jgi:hypothetical protein|nr:hypothetical protein [Gammaproteobacteria bacterium]